MKVFNLIIVIEFNLQYQTFELGSPFLSCVSQKKKRAYIMYVPKLSTEIHVDRKSTYRAKHKFVWLQGPISFYYMTLTFNNEVYKTSKSVRLNSPALTVFSIPVK